MPQLATRLLGMAVALGCIATPVGAQEAGNNSLSIVVPSGEKVPWRGIPVDEAAGSVGAMLYPAPNPAGLLVAILTHAALSRGSQDAERRAKQEEADRVLQPHGEALSQMSPTRLLEQTLKHWSREGENTLIADTGAARTGWIIELQPAFSMAPDGRTIVLDNAVKVYKRATPESPHFQNIVRIVSSPKPAGGDQEQDAAKLPLLDESAQMLAHSFDLALQFGGDSSPDAVSRTQRYRFGDGEKMERGAVLASVCSRVVLRTLRDWLMSVPVDHAAPEQRCTSGYPPMRPKPG